LLEKLKSKIPRLVFLQNPHKILSWILDMLWELSCLDPVPKVAQSCEGIFLYKLSCDIGKSA
jgi:hypothetical protein